MSKHPVASAIALAFAASLFGSGCDQVSQVTEQEHIQRAKDFEDKGNLKSSIIELKNAIQKNPDNAQARLLLGQVYLKSGMGAAAEKELTQAQKLGVSQESIQLPLGEALLLMGEYRRVLDQIQPSDQTSSINRARIFQMRGDALIKLGKVKEGCGLFQQSLDIDPANVPTYWGLAQCAVADQDLPKAKKWLDNALKIKDKQASTLVYLGDWQQRNKNIPGALAAYTSAIQLEPDNLQALHSRATLYITENKLELARTDIEKTRQLAPRSLGANYLQALLKFNEKKYSEARDALHETLKIDPENLPALLLGGSIENALGNPQTAEAYLNKVLRASPRNAYALRMLAATQLQLGRPDEAARTLDPVDMDKASDVGILVAAGKVALAKSDFALAVSHFEKASKLSPNNASIRTDLGLARLAQGDSRAMADLQAAVAMGGSDDRASNFIILKQLKQQQFDAALASIAAMQKKLPQSPLPWNYRGAAYLGKKDNANARQSFQQALKLDPKSFAAALSLAQLDIEEGQPTRASKHLENILAVDPTNQQAMLALADISLAGKDEKAYVNWLDKAIKAHPQSIPAREKKTAFYLRKGNKSQALATAQEAVSTNPKSPDALNLLASTQIALGDKTNAIASLITATRKAPQSHEAYLRLALAQMANNALNDARASIASALKLKPDHLPSQDALLRIELLANKPEAALRVARQIQANFPQSPLGYDREAAIHLSQKNLAQSIQAYEKALQKGTGSAGFIKLFRTYLLAGNPSGAEKRLGDWLRQYPKDKAVLALAANYNLSKGRNKEAIAQYQEVQRQAPNNLGVLNNLAILYQREKDSRALSTAEQALKLAPDSPTLQDTLGWILVEQGQTQRGLALLQKALAKTPRSAAVRYHHAAALAQLGHKSQARTELVKLLADTPKFAEVESARALLKSL